MPLKAWNTRAPSEAQAELKELGERFDGLAKAHEAMVPHQVELRHERDAAVAELADVKPDRDRWEKLAREAAEARVKAQADAAAMRAALNESQSYIVAVPQGATWRDHQTVALAKIEAALSTTAGKDLLEQLRQLSAERDAASALVDRLAGVLEKAEWVLAHSTESWPIKHRMALEATKAAIAEVAKSLSPRTTENTKPQ